MVIQTDTIKDIFKNYIKYLNYYKYGDDILISLILRKVYNIKHLIIGAEITKLYRINTNKNYSNKWQIIKSFKEKK